MAESQRLDYSSGFVSVSVWGIAKGRDGEALPDFAKFRSGSAFSLQGPQISVDSIATGSLSALKVIMGSHDGL